MKKIIASIILAVVLIAPTPAQANIVKFGCLFSHRAQVDPIVAPGQTSAHMHDFFGNTTTDANSTYATMTASASNTTCSFAGDTAGYWVPTMYDKNGNIIPPKRIIVYYRDEPQGNVAVTPFPPDFRMIAGFPHAFEPHANSFWGWSCNNTDDLSPTLGINCSSSISPKQLVQLRLFFPMCGMVDANGNIVTDSPDHRSHVAYPVGGNGYNTGHCPTDHPVKLPRLTFDLTYNVTDCITAGCYLSSDAGNGTPPGGSLHGDFWNTWQQPALVGLVNKLNS